MSTLHDLIRYESPHSGLALRKTLYGAGETGQAIADCLALANAEVKGRRFLFLGVDADASGTERLLGVEREALLEFRQRLERLVPACIEPGLDLVVRAIEVEGRLIGYVRLKNCESPPYLAARALGRGLRPGQGFIRRGARNHPLTRQDLQRLFARSRAPAVAVDAPVEIGFAGHEPQRRIVLPALPVNKLPSELAAERLKALLIANDQSRDLFGRTETQIARLMHAKLYGVDVPFQKRGDDTLVSSLKQLERDYGPADRHYMYEVRSHKLNLIVANRSDDNLHDAVLELSVPRLRGTGIADRIYAEADNGLPRDGYPTLVSGASEVRVRAELETLYAGLGISAFREPLRFWVRDEAVGRLLPIAYTLHADALAAPVEGRLEIELVSASLKSV